MLGAEPGTQALWPADDLCLPDPARVTIPAHAQVVFVPDFFAFFSARFSLMLLAAVFFVSFLVSRLFDMGSSSR